MGWRTTDAMLPQNNAARSFVPSRLKKRPNDANQPAPADHGSFVDLLSQLLLGVILRASLHAWVVERWSSDQIALSVESVATNLDDHIQQSVSLLLKFAAKQPEFSSLPSDAHRPQS